MGITVRELVTKLGFKTSDEAIKAYDKRIDDTKKNAGQLGKKLQSVGDGMTRMGKTAFIFGTLPIIAMGAAFVKASSDAEETTSKFNVVFKDVRKEADKTAENLVDNFGLSRKSAKELLSDTGDLLSGFGFTGEAALDLSKKTNELAVDLASFTNFVGGTEGASKALTKALLGERESVKSLGIAILDKDVKERIALMRSKGLTFESERQAKAYATLAIAQEQSKNAIGDYARTQDQLANRWRRFKGILHNISVGFGDELTPLVNKALKKLEEFAVWLDKLSPKAKRWILITLGVVAALGPLLIIVGGVISLIGGLILKFVLIKATMVFLKLTIWGLVSTFGVLALKIAFVIAVIAAIGAAIAIVVEDYKFWKAGNKSLIGSLLGDYDDLQKGIDTFFADLAQTWVHFIDGDMAKFQKDMEFWATVTKGFFSEWVDDIGKMFGEDLADALRTAGGWVISFAENVGAALGTLFGNPKEYLREWEDVLFHGPRPGGKSQLFQENFGRAPIERAAESVARGGSSAIPESIRRPIGPDIRVEGTVNLTLPDTTLEENRRILKEDAKGLVFDSFGRLFGEAVRANPVRE